MNYDDLGKYFIKNGELYEVISYINNPSLQLKNIRTGQKEVIAIGSMLSKEYNKLYGVPYDEDSYNLSKATPVENINLESNGVNND